MLRMCHITAVWEMKRTGSIFCVPGCAATQQHGNNERASAAAHMPVAILIGQTATTSTRCSSPASHTVPMTTRAPRVPHMAAIPAQNATYVRPDRRLCISQMRTVPMHSCGALFGLAVAAACHGGSAYWQCLEQTCAPHNRAHRGQAHAVATGRRACCENVTNVHWLLHQTSQGVSKSAHRHC